MKRLAYTGFEFVERQVFQRNKGLPPHDEASSELRPAWNGLCTLLLMFSAVGCDSNGPPAGSHGTQRVDAEVHVQPVEARLTVPQIDARLSEANVRVEGELEPVVVQGGLDKLELTGKIEPLELKGDLGTVKVSGELPKLSVELPDEPLVVQGGLDKLELTGKIEPLKLEGDLGAVQFSGELPKLSVELPDEPLTLQLTGLPTDFSSIDVDYLAEEIAKKLKAEAPPNIPKPLPRRFWLSLIVILLAGTVGGSVRRSLDPVERKLELHDLQLKQTKFTSLIESLGSKRDQLEEDKSKVDSELKSIAEQAGEAGEEQRARAKNLRKELHSLEQRIRRLDRQIEETNSKLYSARVRRTALRNVSTFQPIASGIVAALMVPGVLLFIPGDIVKRASGDDFHLLAFGSVCLIAGAIGQPFVLFVLNEAQKRIERRQERKMPSPKEDSAGAQSATDAVEKGSDRV